MSRPPPPAHGPRKLTLRRRLNILLAGRDTTAGLIGWAVYLLARDARVYAKLRRSLEDVFGTGTPGVWRQPTFEELKGATYLRHVVNEGTFPCAAPLRATF